MTFLQRLAFDRIKKLSEHTAELFPVRWDKDATSINISIRILKEIRDNLSEQQDWIYALNEIESMENGEDVV